MSIIDDLKKDVEDLIVETVMVLNGTGTNDELGKKATEIVTKRYDILAAKFHIPFAVNWIVHLFIYPAVCYVVNKLHANGTMPKNPYTVPGAP